MNSDKIKMESKIKPNLEFVFNEKDRPGKIGVRMIGKRQTGWYSEKFAKELILKFQREVDFYKELCDAIRKKT